MHLAIGHVRKMQGSTHTKSAFIPSSSFPPETHPKKRIIRANLDKDHFELRENIGTLTKSIAFYGPIGRLDTGTTIRFYKNWDKYLARKNSKVPGKGSSKPITPGFPIPFTDDGASPQANGASTKHGYIDTRGAAYEYAILAIAILLENQLPGKVFLTALEPFNI